MTISRTLERSFAGGEVTPEFYGRIDDPKYQTGLATCRNFIVSPHGPIKNRSGTVFVREVKDSAKRTRLIPFSYSTTQTMALEFGEEYIRFHTNGGTLLDTGVPYEVVTPYAEADIFDIHYVQSADVLTLVHPNYPPMELRRLGALNWTLTDIEFASLLAAPTGVSATPTVPMGATNLIVHTYVVTALGESGFDESLASTQATATNNLNAVGAYNTVSWAAVAGATRYNVYAFDNGLFGFLGQTTGVSFVDDNITVDVSQTPPEENDPFNGAGNYPAATTYQEQRRGFAGTLNAPQTFWLTKSGTESNLSFSIPQRDDDAISYRVASREANTIRHMVPLGDLILLTSSAEYRISAAAGDALTATNLSVKPQSYNGASNVQPVLANNNLIYAAARGGHVREMTYNDGANGYISGDITLRAPHLFDGRTIRDMALSKSPFPVVWFINDTGLLLGLTYVPEQQVGAWHWHDTGLADLFESVTVVAEGEDDAIYVVVQRTIDGDQVRYVERFQTRFFLDAEDAYFVDAGVIYDGAPISSITGGIDHLEGCTVNILADGAVHPQRVVTGGEITLDVAASVIHVGLPIIADAQTLPLAVEAPASGQGRVKNVNQVVLRVHESSGIFAGPSVDKLTEAKIRTTEPYDSPPSLKTGEVRIRTAPTWQDGAQILIRQSSPLPLTIASIILETNIAG